MCGIVAAVARRNVVPILLEGLRRLEYRGYDSAGVAVIDGSSEGKMRRLRSCGRVAELKKLADEQQLEGMIGIGHTRWATHGVPSERNAHPHISGGISVVHNGIIENHATIRAQLQAAGYEFTSDTDTEVIAHLVHSKASLGLELLDAVRSATQELKGAYAIAVIGANDPSRLVVARMGAPLLLGLADGENFAASDTSALLQVTPQHRLPRRRRLRRGHPSGTAHRRRARPRGRAAAACQPAHRRQHGARQLPALHAKGNLRAAGGGLCHFAGAV